MCQNGNFRRCHAVEIATPLLKTMAATMVPTAKADLGLLRHELLQGPRIANLAVLVPLAALLATRHKTLTGRHSVVIWRGAAALLHLRGHPRERCALPQTLQRYKATAASVSTLAARLGSQVPSTKACTITVSIQSKLKLCSCFPLK